MGASGTPAAPAAPTWLSSLREQGFDFKGDSEADAIKHLVDLRKQHQQLAPYAPYVGSYVQNIQDFNRYLSQKGQQPAQVQPTNEPWHKKYWNPPEFNQNWQSMLDRDPATGQIVAKPGTPPDVVLKYQAYQQYVQEQMGRMTQNPAEYFAPMIRELAAEEARKHIQGSMQQQQSQQVTEQFTNANQGYLYEFDANGQVKMQPYFDQQSGQMKQARVFSPLGQRFMQYAKQQADYYAQHGIRDIPRVLETAWAMAGRDYQAALLSGRQQPNVPGVQPPPNPAPGQPPVNPRDAANQNFLNQHNGPATAQTNGNAVPTDPPPGTRGYVEAAEFLKNELSRTGVKLSG